MTLSLRLNLTFPKLPQQFCRFPRNQVSGFGAEWQLTSAVPTTTLLTSACYGEWLHKLKDSTRTDSCCNAIHDKLRLLLKFLNNNDDDEVSQGLLNVPVSTLQF
ncbi:hypothetical protein AVEN_241591-1 [Araneus ventricosus]|uniref:Uncharacterized protein n=1 Tax=Araneus ventricosus TaxID=182803 RepID=A0A4Y2H7U0_ARAVE|nr:hypothetical protein AVEN_241591-1 [Araneus ventricosus]